MPNEGRHTGDLVTEPLESVIDPDRFTPRLLALLSNALVWRESHELRRNFGLGTNDWRVISALALRPGSSATEVSDFLGVNKAVVSKSVSVLSAQQLIALLDGPRGSRPMYLTQSGASMHDAMMPISVRGQEIILEGLPQADVDRLQTLLTDMLQKLRRAQLAEDSSPQKPQRPAPARTRASSAKSAPGAKQDLDSQPAQPDADGHQKTAAADGRPSAGAQRGLLQKLRPPNVITQYLRGTQH